MSSLSVRIARGEGKITTDERITMLVLQRAQGVVSPEQLAIIWLFFFLHALFLNAQCWH